MITQEEKLRMLKLRLPIFVEANLLSTLTEALTTDHEVVLANDGMTIHANAASTRASAVFFGVSVPEVISHDLTSYKTQLVDYTNYIST